jgi:hypothetical protein
VADLLSYALTTLADVKETLGIDAGVTTKDNLIKRKINQATEMIEGYCKRRFADTTYTQEEYDGTGINQLILRQYPITDTETLVLQERDTTLNLDNWTTVDSQYYFADNNAGVLDTRMIVLKTWNRYRVTYSAGYTTIPADLAEACATLAAFLVDNATSGTGVKRKKEGQREIVYYDASGSGGNANSLFEQLNIDDILNRYSYNRLIDDV